MAEALYLVSKGGSDSPANTLIDKIVGVVINKDDAQTNPQIIADAIAQCRVGGHPLRDGYFDTVDKISDLTAGSLKDNKDIYILFNRTIQKVEG
jgi:hypothetical protein